MAPANDFLCEVRVLVDCLADHESAELHVVLVHQVEKPWRSLIDAVIWKTPFVGMSGRFFSMGSGMTPGAPEIGWPPPSYIKEKLTASCALFGQNEVAFDIESSCLPKTFESLGIESADIAMPPSIRKLLRSIGPFLIPRFRWRCLCSANWQGWPIRVNTVRPSIPELHRSFGKLRTDTETLNQIGICQKRPAKGYKV